LNLRGNHFLAALVAGLIVLAQLCRGGALAQDAAAPSAAAAAALGLTNGPNADEGVPVRGWLLFPSIFAGAVFNDNIYSTTSNRVARLGFRLQPKFEAESDNGIHATSVYANGDFQFYPDSSGGSAFGTGRVGAIHTYEPTPDITVRWQADYTRMNSLFPPGFWTSPAQTWQPYGTITDRSVFSNQTVGSLSLEKKLSDLFFVKASGGVQYSSYDQPSQSGSPYGGVSNPFSPLNGVDYSASLRAGVMMTPQIYAFVEGGADFHRYTVGLNDTNDYRLIAGVGSDLIRLMRGEAYAGYATQVSSHGNFGATGLMIFGARLSYYPTPYLVVSGSVEQSLAATNLQGSPVSPFGTLSFTKPSSAAHSLLARAQIDYSFSQAWTGFVQAGYGVTRYPGFANTPSLQVTSVGAGVKYNLWRNLAMTAEYQYNYSNSRYAGGSTSGSAVHISQNVISVGLTYQY